MLQQILPLALSPLFFSLFPNGKSERVPEDERGRLFFIIEAKGQDKQGRDDR